MLIGWQTTTEKTNERAWEKRPPTEAASIVFFTIAERFRQARVVLAAQLAQSGPPGQLARQDPEVLEVLEVQPPREDPEAQLHLGRPDHP